MLRHEIRRAGRTDRVDFKVIFDQGDSKPLVDFYSICSPGDNLEPTITIMLIGED